MTKMTFEEFKKTFKGKEETCMDLTRIHGFTYAEAEAQIDELIQQEYNTIVLKGNNEVSI